MMVISVSLGTQSYPIILDSGLTQVSTWLWPAVCW